MLTIIAQSISIFPIARLKTHEHVPEQGISVHSFKLANKVKIDENILRRPMSHSTTYHVFFQSRNRLGVFTLQHISLYFWRGQHARASNCILESDACTNVSQPQHEMHRPTFEDLPEPWNMWHRECKYFPQNLKVAFGSKRTTSSKSNR
ncbi:hypothetical protein N7528_002487 [Penicillium herquei]|nr:hypothetical protein N7528_002487 [Penicillium herquei]